MARSKTRLFAFVTIAAFGPALVACHLITGLNDYDKVDCKPGDCDAGGDGNETSTDGPGGDRDVNVLPTVDGAAPVSWPRWKMPNYEADGATGDGSVENPHSYAPVAGGGMKDNVTGLVWLQPLPVGGNQLKTFDDAKKFCETAPGGGWRLPSRIELVTLLDMLASGAKMNAASFPGASPGVHWTYSEVRTSKPTTPKKYWAVDFDQGGVVHRDVGSTAFVRCVKGGT